MRVHTGGKDLGAGLYEYKEGDSEADLKKQWLANREGRATLIELTKDEPRVRKAMDTPSMWNKRIPVSSQWADKAKKSGGQSGAAMPEILSLN